MNIFEDTEKVLENTKESARALGFNVPDKVKKNVLVAKNNCKICRGRGVNITSFPGNNGNHDTRNVLCGCVSEKEIEVEDQT